MTFVTLFRDTQNILLIKDVGEIPYHLEKKFGIDAKIVTYKPDAPYTFTENEVKGLKIEYVENTGRLKYFEKSFFSYIWKHAKEIDILNLYHYEPPTFIYGLIYKLRNPGGFLYLKLDNDLRSQQEIGSLYKYGNSIVRFLFSFIEVAFQKAINLASIETSKGYELINQAYPILRNKLILMHNGLDVEQLKSTFSFEQAKPENKINNFLTVCRIGTKQKNISLLLKVIPELELKEWAFTLIGPIENSFFPEIEAFYKNYPNLKEKVIFTGNMEDRARLFEYFAKSKVFCLPSLWESFGFVLIEAILFGCYVLITDTMNAADMITRKDLGQVIPINDKEALRNSLQNIINGTTNIKTSLEDNQSYIEQKFNWPIIIEKLYNEFLTHGLNSQSEKDV